MTDTTPTQQDRDALAEVLAGSLYPRRRDIDRAELILTSDWLAEHVRAKQAEAWALGMVSGCNYVGEQEQGSPADADQYAINPYLPEGAERG